MKRVLTGSRCRCRECGDVFNSVTAFDRHRVGKYPNQRRCMSAAERRAEGMSRNDAGFWIVRRRTKAHVKPVTGRISAGPRHTPLPAHQEAQ
jgi:hypothetical protein